MKYLYIFEDGELVSSNDRPSESDMTAVADGLLQIVTFEDGQFKHHDSVSCEFIPVREHKQ